MDATPNTSGLLSPLTSKNFRWLFGGQIVSTIGSQLSSMVMVALVLPNSERPALDIGLVMGARYSALALFIVVGGVLADRVNRFKLLALTDILSIVALVPIILLGAATPIAVVVLSSFVLGACEALFTPTYDAAVVSTVSKEQLAPANALTKTVRGFAKIVGPPLSGIVVAGVGVSSALVIDAISFGASILSLSRLAFLGLGNPGRREGQGLWKDALEGVRTVLALRWLTALEAMAMVHVLLAVGPWLVLLPIVAQRNLGGLSAYGLLLGAFAAGAIPGAVLGAKIRSKKMGLVLLGGLLPFGLCCIALAVTSELWVLISAFFVAGVGTELTDVVKITEIQRQVPGEFLGRVFALDFFASFVTMPLGQLLVPVLVAPGAEQRALVFAGAVILVTTPLVALVPGVAGLGKNRISHGV